MAKVYIVTCAWPIGEEEIWEVFSTEEAAAAFVEGEICRNMDLLNHLTIRHWEVKEYP